MSELKFVKFSTIVETNGVPQPGYYIRNNSGMELCPCHISYDPYDGEDILHTAEYWAEHMFLCLDGVLVDLAELTESSGIKIGWAVPGVI